MDKVRQQRENDKTQTEIADKIKRLNLLQRDTSGAYALEINQLADEIETSQQDFTDTLVDQLVSDMENQFAIAAEERQRNIEMLQNQKDWRAENGFYWAQTMSLMGQDEETLKQFFMENDPAYRAMSPEAQQRYIEEFLSRRSAAWGWYTSEFNRNSPASYAAGGLVDYTGIASVHGSSSKPELMLNASDTKNFLVLKDVLNDFLKDRDESSSSTTENSGPIVIEIYNNIEKIDDDYSVDRMMERMKRDIAEQAGYRGVTVITPN